LRAFTRTAIGGTVLFFVQRAMVSSMPYRSIQRSTSHRGWEWRTAMARPGSFAISGKSMFSPSLRAFRRIAFTKPAAAGLSFFAMPTASLTAANGGIRSVKRSW
jgi:hypothetical protein